MRLVYLYYCPAKRSQKMLPVSSSASELIPVAQHLQRPKSLDSNLQAAQTLLAGRGAHLCCKAAIHAQNRCAHPDLHVR